MGLFALSVAMMTQRSTVGSFLNSGIGEQRDGDVARVLTLARIIHGVKEPRSKPLRSRAMGLYLEEACKFEW